HAAIALCVQRVGVVGPAFDGKLGRASICVTNIKERHRREFIVDRDQDFFGERPGFSRHYQPLSCTESIADPLVLLGDQWKLAPYLAVNCRSLTGHKWPYRGLFAAEAGNHAAVQVAVEFNSQMFP